MHGSHKRGDRCALRIMDSNFNDDSNHSLAPTPSLSIAELEKEKYLQKLAMNILLDDIECG